MIGGGEILRGVMEKNSVYSAPAFYMIPLNSRDDSGLPTLTQRGTIQLDQQFYFLVTSLYCTATSAPGFERNNRPEFVRIFDPQTTEDTAFDPVDLQISLLGDSSINNPVILPIYMLFRPTQLIGVEWTGDNHVATEFKFLTLAGIEYGMKEGI